MGSLIIRVMALSIVLLMAASYAICYIDAFSHPDSLSCNHSCNSTCVMGTAIAILLRLAERVARLV